MKPDWYEDFFWWKIGALTHDPPHKAWIVTGKTTWSDGLSNEGVKAAKKRKLRRHEAAAFAIRATVLGEVRANLFLKEPWKDIIKKSDILASSFDRWQISEIYELWQKLEIPHPPFDVKKVYLFNSLSGDPIRPEIGKIDFMEFEEELCSVWRKSSKLSLNLRYHIFYALYEPLFYEKCLSIPSPADTRTPSHSLFDHLYASATVINWLCSDFIAEREELSPKGLLVRIDLAEIQDFISSSKKLRDVWFSSWFASALAFRTIEELVKLLGPDILIRPTARHNPFYYNLLLHWLEEEELPEEVQEGLKNVVKNVAEKYAGLKDWPRYAVIPATIDLLLPPYDVLSQLLGREIHNENDLITYFYEKYVSYWRKLVDIVLKDSIKRLRLEGKLKERLEEAVEKSDKYGIKSTPPLTMRIITVSLPDELNDKEREQEHWYYDYAFKKLNEKFKLTKRIKIYPACFTNLTKVTEELWKEKKGYRVCTVCGKFPSVLDIPYDEKDYIKIVQPPELQVYLDLGEHLCPYCLIKRLATHRAIFASVAKELIGYPVKSPPSFPSVSSIATYPFMRGLLEAQDDEDVRKTVNEIIEQLKKLKIPPLISPYWDALDELLRDAKDEIRGFLHYDSELTLLPEEREDQRKAEKLRKTVKKSVQDVLDPIFTRINTYYAIVRADGDYIGRLLAGELNGETIGMNYIELLTSSIGNIPDVKAIEFARLIRESANNNIRVVKRMISSELGQKIERTMEKEIEEAARKLCELFSKVLKEGRIPVTPAYHATLSRALMITALKDIEEVQKGAKGIVVYAGGDDFLAFVPVAFALDLVLKTRRHYSIGKLEHSGFHRVGNGYFMTLGKASRSYSIVFGHFKYPMSQLLKLSYEFLKSAKKMQVARGVFKRAKDILLLAYCPRGGGVKVKSALTLSHEKPIKLLMSLVNSIENNLFSHSMIYDLVKEVKKYEKEVQQLRIFDIIENMLSYLLDRNLVIKEARPTARLIASELKELAEYTIFDNEGGEETLLYHILLALWATMAALRGREL